MVHIEEGGITADSAQIASSDEFDSMLVLFGAFGVVCLFVNCVTDWSGAGEGELWGLRFPQKPFP